MDGELAERFGWAAGLRRFHLVLLTTLTTFCGLAPMIFETSRQARFLFPMALSLDFGILFATVITLALVPCLYLIVEGSKRFLSHIFAVDPRREDAADPCEIHFDVALPMVTDTVYRSVSLFYCRYCVIGTSNP